MTDGVKRIAIVGAGTAGQAVAIALGRAHADAEIMLFEQSPNPGPVGAGFLLQPTGQAVLALALATGGALAVGKKVIVSRGGNWMVPAPQGHMPAIARKRVLLPEAALPRIWMRSPGAILT